MIKKYKLAVAAFALLSGATSLVYESLWIRVLSLGVGSTSGSMSMVLSIFFLGLAAGSWLSGRWATRIRNPWLAYGVLEGCIGLYASVVIFGLFKFQAVLALLPLAGSLSVVGLVAKFLLVLLALVFPTLCMGATLPLLVRISEEVAPREPQTVGRIYGLNTLGAVVGSFLTGFLLIPSLGVLTANLVTALVNGLILLAAVYLGRTEGARSAPGRAQFNAEAEGFEPLETAIPEDAAEASRLRSLILLSCAVCGFTAILAEVVWNKYLGILLGSNIYGLGLLLSIYLVGIAAGSLILSVRLRRMRRPFRTYAWLCVGAMAATTLASQALDFVPVVANLVGYYGRGRLPLLAIKSVVTLLVLFLPTCAFGMLFPLAVELLGRGNRAGRIRSLGAAYSLNTLGSIAGASVTGLVLIPWIGSGGTIAVGIVALGLLTAALIARMLGLRLRERVGLAAALVAVLAGLAAAGSLRFRNIISAAYVQANDPNLSLADAVRYFSREYEDFQLIVEGRSGIISLSHDPQDGVNYRRILRLKTNGLNESVYDLDNLATLPKYEALLGSLPYLFVTAPRNAFIVGYGGGYTVDFLTSTAIKDVRVAELEAGILEAAKKVRGGTNPILARSNLHLEIEDARFVLGAGTHGRFDIIVSQPSHSWLAGVANLFTREFFEIADAQLTDRGVFSQWLNLYNMDEPTLRSILRTFYEVFPHGAVFTNVGDQEMIMLGSRAPLQLNLQKLALFTRNPTFRKQLAEVPFNNPYDLLANFSLGRKDVLRITEGAPLNTDANAHAEVAQTRLFYSPNRDLLEPQNYLEREFTGDLTDFVRPQDLGSADFYEGLLGALREQKRYGKLLTVLAQYETAKTSAEESLRLQRLGYWNLQVERFPSAIGYLEKSLAAEPRVETLRYLLAAREALGRYPEMLADIRANGGLTDDAVRCFRARASLASAAIALRAGEPAAPARQAAHAAAAPLLAQPARYHAACGVYYEKTAGLALLAEHRPAEAIPLLEAYYRAYARDSSVVAGLVTAYLETDALGNGRNFATYLPTVFDEERQHAQSLAKMLRARGYASDADALDAKAAALPDGRE